MNEIRRTKVRIQMKKKSNRRIASYNEGFSLIELVITVAILMIFSVSIFSLMMSGSTFFSKSSIEADMQSEAGLLKNRLDNLVTDTARSMSFSTAGEYGTTALLTIYGEDSIAYLGWHSDNSIMYYLEKDVTQIVNNPGGGYTVSFTPEEQNVTNWIVLAENVTDFRCNLDKVGDKSHPVFSCDLGFANRKVTYETSHIITLRNKVEKDLALDNAYEDVILNSSRVLGIILNPYLADTKAGGTVTFSPEVKAVGHPDQSVSFEILGNKSVNTVISNTGVLTVGTDETASTLTVVCKSNVDSTISAVSIVNLSRVTGVTISAITEAPAEDKYYFPGGQVQFEAKVRGNLISKEGNKVTWEVNSETTGQQPKIISTTDSTCTIQLSEVYGATIKVTATSVLDDTIKGEYTLYSLQQEIKGFNILPRGGAPRIKRNGQLQLLGYVDGTQISTDEYDLTWEIVSDPTGGKVTIDNSGLVTAQKTIAYNREYSETNKNPIKVKATATSKSGEVQTMEAVTSLKIEPVQIIFDAGYAVVVAGKTTRIKMEVEGLVVDYNDVTVTKKPAVRGFSLLKAGEILVLGATQDTLKAAGEAKVRASLSYSGTVFSELPVYFRAQNIIVDNIGAYAPVPGDNIFPDSDNNNKPDKTTAIEINGMTFIYVPNGSDWYLVVNGQKYSYDANGTNGSSYVPMLP